MAAPSYQVDGPGYADIRIANIAIAPYDIPLAQPWVSARGSLERRRGWLLRLQTSEGALGFGDCAPLPGAGTESNDDAARTMRSLLPSLADQRGDAVLDMLGNMPAAPAVRCAVETALLDLVAAAAGQPMAQQLNPEAVERVTVNAMIGALDREVGTRAQRAVGEGYHVLKIKLGVGSPGTEVAALIELAQGLPAAVRLRLDANRAWDQDTARSVIEVLSDLPIEGLEEPVRGGDAEALRALQAHAPWPLAMDESLPQESLALQGLLSEPPVRRFVLKPMVLGGPLRTLEIARRACDAGVEVIVTTTVDTAVGTFAALHAAAALGGGSTHGLATSGWLAENIAEPPAIQQGKMTVGTRAGLGATPYESIRFKDVADV